VQINYGDFTWTPASTQIGPHTFTVKVCDNGSPVLCDQEEITVTVGKRATLLVYSGDASGQYSDSVTVKATLTDNGGGLLYQGTELGSKSVTFTIGSQSASATTGLNGLAETTITFNQAAGTPGGSSFGGDDLYLGSSDSDPFQVNQKMPHRVHGDSIGRRGNLTLGKRWDSVAAATGR
jgi:hypothetical protein